jgi:transcriptional regulator with XRE-family HTH domain
MYDNSMKNTMTISDTLKKRRLELGLSLSELARLTDTSAATISRYENGWTRFEVGTLRKLALALRTRMQVTFSPIDNAAHPGADNSEYLTDLKRLFWDCDFTKDTIGKHPVWVVERVLEMGGLSDIKALQLIMGRRPFLEYVQKCTRVSEKTSVLWNAVLRREGMECMKKSFRQTAWNF